MSYTDAQIKAIETHNRNVLVSAAAGSGKTTVLVERIINRLLDESDPIDVDRMLVLTFTNATAAQMRDKIAAALEKMAEDNPGNTHLARQAMLVQNAQISTFHSFCQEIIRNHFYEIGADPSMRTLDEGEGKLMRADALSRVLEDAYESENDNFRILVESLATGKGDKVLETNIEKIYRYAQAQPRPDEWLLACRDFYDVENADDLKGKSWFKDYIDSIKKTALKRSEICLKLLNLCDLADGPHKYRPMIENDYQTLCEMANADDYERLCAVLNAYQKQKLGRITEKDGVDEYIRQYVQSSRTGLTKFIENAARDISNSLDDKAKDMKASLPLIKELVRLTTEYNLEYTKAKEEAGVIDFNDMEHMAIRILENPDGITAGEYRERFVEIYVDEYQDSNLTQEEIIKLVSRGDGDIDGNVFMVGDVKQSIYRFRMARPDLFLAKYNSFLTEDRDTANMRIDLSHNFRSRQEVLNSVNEIFEQIMVRDIGGIEYDDAARLNYGGLYGDDPSDEYRTELILGIKDEDVSDAETEAQIIGDRIKRIVGVLDVKDSITGGMRKAKYSDIVILLRSLNGRDTVYKDVLESIDVPAYVATSTGYFGAIEVETLLTFLKVIDNPLNDIPLATTMRSFFGGFSDEELGVLRVGSKNEYLYNSIKAYITRFEEERAETGGEDSKLYNKCCEMLSQIDYYREQTKRKSVYEIVREIIDGEYGDYVRLGTNGVRAQANLNMLLTKAEAFGKMSYKGLFHFLRYIDLIKRYEVDFGDAEISDESDDVVRIMTIHKSKGLEFPVVFVSGISKTRNTTDENGALIAEADGGLGIDVVDLDKRTKRQTMLKTYIKGKLETENLAEEIRILYVALTRAKEKLIMVSSIEDAAKDFYEKDISLDMCASYLDMIVYTKSKLGKLKETDVIEMNLTDIIDGAVSASLEAEDRRMNLLKLAGILEKTSDLGESDTPDLPESLYFNYPYEGKSPAFFKLSVSDLKKQSYEDALDAKENDISGDDAMTAELFMDSNATNSGTHYGTAFHRMLELWDYSISFEREEEITCDEVSAFFADMAKKGRIDIKQLESVKTAEIVSFIKSDLGKRMAKANENGKLFREQPFVLGIDANDVAKMQSTEDGSLLLQIPDDENMMLVQGIIDAYWVEEDGIVILDYKTDRVQSKEELVNRYHVQLDYYEKALLRLTDLPVKKKIIYSARLHEIIEF